MAGTQISLILPELHCFILFLCVLCTANMWNHNISPHVGTEAIRYSSVTMGYPCGIHVDQWLRPLVLADPPETPSPWIPAFGTWCLGACHNEKVHPLGWWRTIHVGGLGSSKTTLNRSWPSKKWLSHWPLLHHISLWVNLQVSHLVLSQPADLAN